MKNEDAYGLGKQIVISNEDRDAALNGPLQGHCDVAMQRDMGGVWLISDHGNTNNVTHDVIASKSQPHLQKVGSEG